MKTFFSSPRAVLLLALAAGPGLGCSAADIDGDGNGDGNGNGNEDVADSDAVDGENVDIDETGIDGGKVGTKGYIGAYKSPSIVRDGATYHAYFAADRVEGKRRNMPHATFTDDGTWAYQGDALPKLGNKADDSPGAPVWAPGVARIDEGHWMAYYTAHLVGTAEKKCIWRAHASSPEGPFQDTYGGPLVCGEGSHWALDAYPVKDAKGDWHLAVRLDHGDGINTISLRQLTNKGQHFAKGSTWQELAHNAPDTWEQPVMENAGVVRLAPPTGEPHWFVFYSARAWDDNSYAIGYADCGPSIGGPCVKKTKTGPWMATNKDKKLFGPGTPTFYDSQAGDTLMSIQAWEHSGGKANAKNDGQIMRTYQMSVTDEYVPKAKLVRIDE